MHVARMIFHRHLDACVFCASLAALEDFYSIVNARINTAWGQSIGACAQDNPKCRRTQRLGNLYPQCQMLISRPPFVLEPR